MDQFLLYYYFELFLQLHVHVQHILLEMLTCITCISSIAHRESDLNYGVCPVEEPAYLTFTLNNLSQTDPVRFQWPISPCLSFSPSVGHIHPCSSREITTTFTAVKPKKFQQQRFAGKFWKIVYSKPLNQVSGWINVMYMCFNLNYKHMPSTYMYKVAFFLPLRKTVCFILLTSFIPREVNVYLTLCCILIVYMYMYCTLYVLYRYVHCTHVLYVCIFTLYTQVNEWDDLVKSVKWINVPQHGPTNTSSTTGSRPSSSKFKGATAATTTVSADEQTTVEGTYMYMYTCIYTIL